MTDWWQQPYPGAPMVKVPGFPRPLYPSDAAQYGKKPSVDGPDVVAYKRTVSRAGRWPWQPFDDTFSNSFAHGSGGNVGVSGLAGVQRQQSIDATGWLGKASFNLLRSIVIPDGLPHAGQMAMDATAAGLIDTAWKMYGGHEPDPPSGTLRQAALAKAISQLGAVESPSGSNRQKYGEWYGMNGQPWCAIFCTWCFEQSGDSPAFVRGQRYAYVPYVVGDARADRYGLTTTDTPVAGDLVCYDWNLDGVYDHVGIFEAWTSGTFFTCVEGNTSTADQSNGGQVMRRSRDVQAQAVTFIRVAESG
jgi:hypothetical protein